MPVTRQKARRTRRVLLELRNQVVEVGTQHVRTYQEMRSHRSGSGALEKIKKLHKVKTDLYRLQGKEPPKHEYLDKLELAEKRSKARAELARKMEIEYWEKFRRENRERIHRIKQKGRVEIKKTKGKPKRRTEVSKRTVARKSR